jgi:protein involved in polysaccharide export with SLBB domain
MNRFSYPRQLVCGVLASCLLGACAFGAGSAETKKSSTGSSGSSSSVYGSNARDSRESSRDKQAPTGDGTIGLDTPATDPSYRLSRGDEVAIQIFNEPEFSTAQRIDNRGIVRMPYAGEIEISNRTVREAETYLEKLFVEKKLLRSPMVTIGVRAYASREVSVLGPGVSSPGKYNMPPEASSVEIVDVITARGYSATSKLNDVKVTRMLETGEEKVLSVDVEAIMKGSRNAPRSFLIYPGDRIYVPQRVF